MDDDDDEEEGANEQDVPDVERRAAADNTRAAADIGWPQSDAQSGNRYIPMS